MDWLRNRKLGTKLNLLVVTIIVVLAAVMSIVVYQQLGKGFKAAAKAKAESVLGLSYQYIDQKYPGSWQIRDGVLYKGNSKINDNFSIVDKIGKLSGGDTVTIFQGDTRVSTNVMIDGKRAIGTKLPAEIAEVVLKQGKTYQGEAYVLGETYQATYQPLKNEQGEIIGIFFVGAPQSLIQITVISFMKLFLITLAVVVVLAIMMVYWFTKRITKKLQVIEQALEKAGNGDFTYELTADSTDEVGLLTNSFNKMRTSLRALMQQLASSAVSVAASAEELTASADQNSKAAEQIATTIQEMAHETDKQVDSVHKGRDAIEQLSQGVQEISSNTKAVSSLANQASTDAEDGHQRVQTAISQMNAIHQTILALEHSVKGLGERSQQIGRIIEVITGIAGQTNLLALNAAIEAARAGEQGRGFAVVADEVRKLAEQSSKSAQEIALLVTAIQGETDTVLKGMESGMNVVAAGIQVVDSAGEAFGTIKKSVSEVAQRVQQVSFAVGKVSTDTETIVHSIRLIQGASEETAAGTQNVSAVTEEQLASMEEIHSFATALAETACNLQEEMGKFTL